LLTQSQRDRLDVILVSPRNPLNIGAVARAMANFAFAQLTVVAPYQAHWQEAKSAVGAGDLLHRARQCATLAEATADCTLVVGTGTIDRRKPEQPVLALPCLAPHVRQELARAGRVALVFGPEKRGLTRDDLSYCHLLVAIPTDPRQPSMNLGQAVAVFLYELATRLPAPSSSPPSSSTLPDHADPAPLETSTFARRPHPQPSATSAQLDLLATCADQVMEAVNDSPTAMREANRRALRLLLRRFELSDSDARRMLRFFRRVLWRLQH
jgi:TrmH family RNA methyltransferase